MPRNESNGLEFSAPGAVDAGLLLLSTDDGIGSDLAVLTPPDVRLHTARVRSYADRQTDRERLEDVESAAHTLVPHLGLDAIGYACTSGNTVLGDDALAGAIRRAHPEARVVTPLTAVGAATGALGLRRLCLVTPYPAALTAALAASLAALGVEVTTAVSLDVPDELLARVEPGSLGRAVADAAGRDPHADGTFVACNALRVAPVLADVEQATGRPVLTSTQTLLWCMVAASSGSGMSRFGRLGRHRPAAAATAAPRGGTG